MTLLRPGVIAVSCNSFGFDSTTLDLKPLSAVHIISKAITLHLFNLQNIKKKVALHKLNERRQK